MLKSSLAVYNFIVMFKILNNGAQPTIRQISTATGIAFSHVNLILRTKLVDDGLVEIKEQPDGARIIDIKGGAWLPPSNYALPDTEKATTS